MNYCFIPIGPAHREPVMAIFNYYIEHSMAAYRQDALQQEAFDHILKRIQGYPAYVAQADDRTILGFAFLSAHKEIVEFSHTADFTCFLHPDKLGAGVGSAILGKLEAEAKKDGITNILASISSFNERSLAFHEKHGFKQCGRFCGVGKKNGRYFDTVWMQKILF